MKVSQICDTLDRLAPAGRGSDKAADGSVSGVERLRRTLRKRSEPDEEALFSAIAEQVMRRRRAWDLSQEELADLCGTTQSAIARIEQGRRPPRIDTLLRVAAALDCDLEVELRPRTEGE
jgi:ribosome-binding protein aMBF1 (putative translation factor)